MNLTQTGATDARPSHQKQCDLLLIQPPAFGEFSPPLGLASLAGYLRSHGFGVTTLDYNIGFFNQTSNPYRHAWKFSEALSYWTEPEIYGETIQPLFLEYAKRVVRDILFHNPRFIGLSILETSVQASFDLIRTIRKFFGDDFRILVGGPEINKLRAREYLSRMGVFCAFHGEAELGLAELLRQDRETGKPRLKEISGAFFMESDSMVETAPAMVRELDSLPFPDFSDFDLDSYAFREKILPIATSRGCIAKCSFCGETNFMNRFRQLSGPRIVSELKNGIERYSTRVFRLNDSLINGNPKILESWVDELLAENIQIVFGAAQARINKKMSDDLFQKLRKAGCQVIQYGVETGSDRLLRIMRKGITSADVRDVVKRTHAAGITVQINLIVGHFEETTLDFLKTLQLIWQTRGFVQVIAVNHYNFDKLSFDTAHAKGIIDMFSEKWRTADGWNTFRVRRAKMIIIHLMMKIFGIKYP